jgi:TolA-binding protein
MIPFSRGGKWAKLAQYRSIERRVLPTTSSTAIAPIALALLLQACATAPAAPPAAAASTVAAAEAAEPVAPAPVKAEVPELELNMPQAEKCKCAVPPTADYTFLEKGYRSLLDGEYKDAMEHFQRYQRLESSPRADLEAGIAIAYVQMLPRSAFYDPVVARNSFRVLREQNAKKLGVHDYTRLMRQSLLNLLELQKDLDELKDKNKTLNEDLKKREEALKRLRDLTLSQKGAAQ